MVQCELSFLWKHSCNLEHVVLGSGLGQAAYSQSVLSCMGPSSPSLRKINPLCWVNSQEFSQSCFFQSISCLQGTKCLLTSAYLSLGHEFLCSLGVLPLKGSGTLEDAHCMWVAFGQEFLHFAHPTVLPHLAALVGAVVIWSPWLPAICHHPYGHQTQDGNGQEAESSKSPIKNQTHHFLTVPCGMLGHGHSREQDGGLGALGTYCPFVTGLKQGRLPWRLGRLLICSTGKTLSHFCA